MLIGIKNTSLDPVWIKTLPSGVAVYRSVFRDMWGSNIIFAGPHKTFTDANSVEQCTRTEIVGDTLHRNIGPLGSEMVAAELIRVGESHCSPLLSIAQTLMTDRVEHDRWVQLYKDNIHQLFCRSSNWEKIDRLRQFNDII